MGIRKGLCVERTLTDGKITTTILKFSVPMIIGNLLQQFYNIVDTLIVGQFVGTNALAAVLNIGLDLLFVLVLKWGVEGAAIATVISQFVSGVGIGIYVMTRYPAFRIRKGKGFFTAALVKEITHFSLLTCIQQSIMNFGILLVQGLINSFGIVVMAAFAAAVKIDSFAYMPVQDFGNAFSIFVAQNYGANQIKRIKQGIKSAFMVAALFSLIISVVVFLFAKPLLCIFVPHQETEVIAVGMQYLRIEGACYLGIGWLFLFYGLYRAMRKPGMSVVLTVISLGSRVILAYVLSAIPAVGVAGIWISVPIGWFLADAAGLLYYCKMRTVFYNRLPVEG